MSLSRSSFRASFVAVPLCALILTLFSLSSDVSDASAIDVIKLSQKLKVLNGFRSSRKVAKHIAFIAFSFTGDGAPTHGLCTGIVISRNEVLTCAHCFYNSHGPATYDRDYYVFVGKRKEYKGPTYKVRKISSYKGYDDDTYEKDFAILTTVDMFPKRAIRKAIIPTTEVPTTLTTMQTAGFGAVVFRGVGNPDDDGKLMQVTLEYHPNDSCNTLDPDSVSFTENDEYICAIHPSFPGGGGGACYGDSGGPLFSEGENNRMVVHGLVAAGDWDCVGDMGYFPNVHKYSSAIHNYMDGDESEWSTIQNE